MPARLAQRAARHGVGVDALAAAVVEIGLVERALEPAGIGLEAVLDVIDEGSEVRRLAPTPALRRWELALSGSGDPAQDELPELCLPARVLQAAGRDLEILLAQERHDRGALAAETAAARHGRTLDAHLLATALLIFAARR